MKKKRNTAVIAAAVAAVLLAASFLLDGVAAAAVKSIQSQYLTASVDAFNKFYIWIYAAMLAATMATMLKARTTEEKGRRVIVMAASIITAVAVTHLLKPIIHRLRPDGMLFVNPVFGNADYSFPSGHTTAASAGAFSAPSTFRIPWLAFTAATIFARVYSNAHFLSDTVGGLIVAAAVGAFVKKLKEKLTTEDMTEIRRQLVHALIGLVLAAFVWKYSHLWYLILIIAAAGMAFSYAIKSTAAAKNNVIKGFRKLAVAALRLVERKEELERFPGKGAILLFLGSGITAAIFDRETAVAAIVILAVGDSVSHLAGRLFGRIRHKWIFAQEKMIEGSVFGFVCASVAASILLPVWAAVVAAAAAMTVEAAKIKLLGKKIDDNLTVPLVAAAVIWVLRLF